MEFLLFLIYFGVPYMITFFVMKIVWKGLYMSVLWQALPVNRQIKIQRVKLYKRHANILEYVIVAVVIMCVLTLFEYGNFILAGFVVATITSFLDVLMDNMIRIAD